VTLEPCPMCLGAMLYARVQTLVYGAPDEKAGAAGSVLDLTGVERFNHRLEVIGGVRGIECAHLLQQFFKERRKAQANQRRGTEEAVTGSTRNRLVL
jgi:tRNA(adenine34) deaminase